MRRRRLGFHLDHVATLRQARRTMQPEPLTAAAIAEQAGVSQVTAHLREDRRHIQERDVRVLRQTSQTAVNLEMSASQEMLTVAYECKPDSVTLVTERREEVTTEGGLDVSRHRDHLRRLVQGLRDADIKVIAFVDPDMDQVRAAHRIDANGVELHTGKYAEARGERDRRAELQRLVDAARVASKLGLYVGAGHGLDYRNIEALVPVAEIEEYNVGHSIVARALWVGLEKAVRDMLDLLVL